MTRPLDGILVVAIEQAIAAPYCSRLLADLGARVIKIERPDGGDFARAYDRRARGIASHFVWCNRSKESLALDLKSAKAREAVMHLVAEADIFIQNLAPGAAGRLGFGATELRRRWPRLITCDISGYGSGGPWQDRKAYDLLIQAEAGLLSITGTPEQEAKVGISIADIASGVAAQSAILAALLRRQKTGSGAHIDISMLEAMAEWMGYPLYYTLDGAAAPRRCGAGHATIYPYGPYRTCDGTVLFGLQNDREWERFCRIVLERDDLSKDPRFSGNAGRAANRDCLEPVIVNVLGGLSTDEATSRLERAEIGMARVNDLVDVWRHPQLLARRKWGEVQTPVGPLPAMIPAASADWPSRLDPVPELGQHTEAILGEFGLSSDL